VIPKIDSEIGISVYCTSFNGCGGKIRQQKDDFQVCEILSNRTFASIKEQEGYAVYSLKKQNIDTNHALENIFRKTGLKLKSLGLKDASAITEQFVCSMNKSKSIENFTSDKILLKRLGFVKKPLSKKDMIGNNFRIKIQGASSNISEFHEQDKILNFYGYQRFGSKRPVTHLIGKAIVQRDFDKAVDLLVSFTSPHDSPENTKLRKRLQDKSKYIQLLKEIPLQMDLEQILVKEIIDHNDSLKALRALPINIRRFFVQAYQAFLFNQTLSMAFAEGEELLTPIEGDICYDNNDIIGKFVRGLDQKLAIPSIGYSYYKKTRFNYQISKILEQEEVSPKDFFIKELQETSNEGGFRNSSIHCTNFSVSGESVSFNLSRGSFATIVLREIMKPEDPFLAGF